MSARRRLVMLWLAVMALNLGGLAGVATVQEVPSVARASEQLEWLLEAIGSPPGEDEIRGRFHGSLLEKIPAPEMDRIIRALARSAPYRVVGAPTRIGRSVLAVVRGKDVTWQITLGIQRGAGNLINHLLIEPHPEQHVPATSWADLDAALHRAAPEVVMLAAQVVDGECLTVHEVAADRPLSLASVHKLYVLGAVAEAVAGKRIGWHDRVPIRADQVVAGSARFGETGRRRTPTVSGLARAMIEVSDNTATETLFELVGRDAVQRAQVTMGMARPELNDPVLSLREFTLLKFARTSSAGEYVALPDAVSRRGYLETRIAGRPAGQNEITMLPTPAHVDTVEWFGSAADICRAHVALQAMASRPGLEPVRAILAQDDPFEPRPSYIASKGGGEPGVATGSWYFEHGERRYVLVILLRNRHAQFALAGRYVLDAHRLLTATK